MAADRGRAVIQSALIPQRIKGAQEPTRPFAEANVMLHRRTMRGILKKALEWSAEKLSSIAANIGRQNDAVEASSKFVDLAPTDQADKSGVYSDALKYALGRPKVSNIALIGPYGSGKSSIIQTFLKRFDRAA